MSASSAAPSADSPAALVLRDLGCEVDVFERSSEALKARGAGIATHPSTTRYFEESSELDASLVEIELPWLQFLDTGGALAYRERMNYRFSSWTTVYRGLMGAFGDERYHLDSEVVDFAQDDHRVTVRFADGSTRTVDLLVCADGISSASRTKLLPGAHERYAGYVAWRAMIPESDLDPESFEVLRDGPHLLRAPGWSRSCLPDPGSGGRARAGAPAREPRVLSQLRRRRRDRRPS